MKGSVFTGIHDCKDRNYSLDNQKKQRFLFEEFLRLFRLFSLLHSFLHFEAAFTVFSSFISKKLHCAKPNREGHWRKIQTENDKSF